jgi:hypothetical protein
MSKINNVRLPNASTGEYDPAQFNQLVRSLEQIVFQLNSTYTPVVSQNTASAATWMGMGGGAGGGFAGGLRGFQLSNGILQPHAMLMSAVDQGSAGITSENIVTYDNVVISNGIRVVDNSKIYVPCSGQYLVTFRFQVSNRSNSVAEFEVWAKDTGVNFPLSNTRFDVLARKSASINAHTVPTVTGIFTVTDPSVNYLQIAWWSDNIDVFLENYPENTSPTRPSISSVILTINFISAA